jgi:acyl-CoA dehydrogenase
MVTSDERAELELFRAGVRRFMDREIAPHRDEWRKAGCVSRQAWLRAGEAGLLCAAIPETYGGGGGTFRHEVVVMEEMARIGFGDMNMPLHSAIVAPYILHYGTEEQKQNWLPRMARGELIGAIAMTEPNTGSDLQSIRTNARLEDGAYILNGQKTFISNGQLAGLILVVAKTAPELRAKGMSLLAVETENAPGFSRGRNLDKLGMKAQDTSELFFSDVRVPAANVVGEINRGFYMLMEQLPQERLIIAVSAVAGMETAIEETLRYVKERTVFGKPIFDFQNTKFSLAEAKTETVIARIFVDKCIEELLAGELSATTAAMAKWWTTQKQCEITDACLQLFGGYGYMSEYLISHLWVDSRVHKIYGGSNETMKDLISRTL